MKKLIGKLSQSKAALLAMGVPAGVVTAVAATADASVSVQENAQQSLNIVGARMINPTTLEILYSNGTRMSMDFYGENIFRIFQDNQGGIIRDPQAPIFITRQEIKRSVISVEPLMEPLLLSRD